MRDTIEPSDEDFVGPRRKLTREQQADQRSKQRAAKQRGVHGYMFSMFDADGNIVQTTQFSLADYMYNLEWSGAQPDAKSA